MAERLYPRGLWLPTGAVLCNDCDPMHPLDGETAAPRMLREDEIVTYCDRCGKEVITDADIAREHNLALRLRRAGINAFMRQTGGMCHNIGVELDDDAYILIGSDWEEKDGELFHRWQGRVYDNEGCEIRDDMIETTDVAALITWIRGHCLKLVTPTAADQAFAERRL